MLCFRAVAGTRPGAGRLCGALRAPQAAVGQRNARFCRGREVVVPKLALPLLSKHIFRGGLMSHKGGDGPRDAWATYANSLEKLRQK